MSQKILFAQAALLISALTSMTQANAADITFGGTLVAAPHVKAVLKSTKKDNVIIEGERKAHVAVKDGALIIHDASRNGTYYKFDLPKEFAPGQDVVVPAAKSGQPGIGAVLHQVSKTERNEPSETRDIDCGNGVKGRSVSYYVIENARWNLKLITAKGALAASLDGKSTRHSNFVYNDNCPRTYHDLSSPDDMATGRGRLSPR